MSKRKLILILCLLAPGVFELVMPANSMPPVNASQENTVVIDGDTIQIGDIVFQLSGIDAPELGQLCGHGEHRRHCGLEAAYALKKWIDLAVPPITCYRINGSASVVVASCVIGEGDVSIALLEGGHAVVAPEDSLFYSPAESPLFRRVEGAAKGAHMGIWKSDFSLPWEWRKQKDPPDGRSFIDPACVVKGKVTEAGERLYYGPLDEAYDNLTVDPKKGERLFCSDDQARAAGWLRPGQSGVEK